MGFEAFCGKGPHTFFLVGSLAARGRLTVIGTGTHLNFYVISVVYT